MVKALMPFTAFDNFSRSTGGGWGRSPSGQEWVTATSSKTNFSSVASTGVGVIDSPAGGDQKPRLITLQTDTKTGTQSMLFAFNPVSWPSRGGGHGDFGPVLLYNNADNYVALRIQPGYDTVSLWRRKTGDTSIIGLSPDAGSNLNPAATANWYYVYRFVRNQWYWCRFEYLSDKGVIRYRIWQDGEDEPTRWASTYTIGKAFPADAVPWKSGQPGFMCFGTDTFRAHVRSVYYYAGSVPEYTSDGWAPDVLNNGSLPITDDFLRTERQGFGWPRGGSLWYGSVIDNPNVDPPSAVGRTENGTATLEFTSAYASNGGYWAFVGNTRTDNKQAEVTVQFTVPSLNDKMTLRVGPRGREGRANDRISGVGLAVEIPLRASTVMRLARRTSLSASGWEAMSGDTNDVVNKNITLVAGKSYNVKVQIVPNGGGYKLNAKLWEQGTTEPSTFDLRFSHTAAPAITKGAPFLNVSSTGTGVINFTSFVATNSVTGETTAPSTTSFTVEQGLVDSITTSSAKIEFRYTGTVTSATQAVIEYFPIGRPQETITIFSSDNEVTAPSGGVFRPVGGLLTGLDPNTKYRVVGRLEQVNVPTSAFGLEFQTKYDGIWIEEQRIHSLTANGFTAAVILRSDLPYESMVNTTGRIRTREVNLVTSQAWSSWVNLVPTLQQGGTSNYAGYGAPNLAKTIVGLLPDVKYEYEIEVTDPNGIDGEVSTQVETFAGFVTTYGRKPLLEWIDQSTEEKQSSPIEIVPEATSARVRIHYKWDIYDQVSFVLNYREYGRDSYAPFTTKYQDDDRRFLKNVSNINRKFWEARLTGLMPGMDYEIEVIVRHPEGTVDGVTRYRLTFTTRRASPLQSRREKHFLFKVYDRANNFLGTWSDAGEPNFGMHENGGVSDMTVKLPRTADVLSSDLTLTLGNRVDVWVIDHTSDGIGRNMVLDSDFDLNGWATSRGWSIVPTDGVDGGACLKVESSSTTSYALSDYLEPANVGAKVKPYRIVVSVSGLLDAFEDELRAGDVNYNSLGDRAARTLRSLFPVSFLSQRENSTVLVPQIDRITNQNYGLLRKAKETGNYKLLDSVELAFSVESLDGLLDLTEEVERQGGRVSVNEETDADSVPYVLMVAAKAVKGQITAQIEYLDIINPSTGMITSAVSEESVATFGNNWQVLKLVFTPPRGTRSMRIRFSAQGDTVGYVDKVQLLPQELLIYRGKIETIKTSIDGDGESVSVEVMGLVAQLTDYYVQFKQWVDRQPARDQPKFVDLAFPEDTAPPPTYIADTNAVKARQSVGSELNRHAILFPEITATGVKVRVYYDGDDNSSADCYLYYTPNMNTVISSVPFTTVTKGQLIYSTEALSMVSSAAGSTVVQRFAENEEFQVLNASLSSSASSVYQWVNVKHLSSGESGWVPFELMTNIRGSKGGGMTRVTLTRAAYRV